MACTLIFRAARPPLCGRVYTYDTCFASSTKHVLCLGHLTQHFQHRWCTYQDASCVTSACFGDRRKEELSGRHLHHVQQTKCCTQTSVEHEQQEDRKGLPKMFVLGTHMFLVTHTQTKTATTAAAACSTFTRDNNDNTSQSPVSTHSLLFTLCTHSLALALLSSTMQLDRQERHHHRDPIAQREPCGFAGDCHPCPLATLRTSCTLQLLLRTG